MGHESLNLRQFLVRNVEDGVYGWHLAAERNAELEEEARREGSPLSSLVERVTDDRLAEHNSVS